MALWSLACAPSLASPFCSQFQLERSEAKAKSLRRGAGQAGAGGLRQRRLLAGEGFEPATFSFVTDEGPKKSRIGQRSRRV